MRVDTAVLDRRLARLAVRGHPAVERLAVEEQDPALGFLLLGQLVVGGRCGRSGRDQQQGNGNQWHPHLSSPPFPSWASGRGDQQSAIAETTPRCTSSAS